MPGAPAHHWRRICPSPASSRGRSTDGQLARPSSTKAARASSAFAFEPLPALVVHERAERLGVPDEAVCGSEALVLLAVQSLRPGAVLVSARPERLGARPARLAPALLPRPLEHEPGRDERPGRAPHHVLGLALLVLADALVEVVGELCVTRQAPRDEQDAGLAGEEARLLRRRELDLLHQVGLAPPGTDGRLRRTGQVEPGLRVTAPPELVQCPQHPGRADVEALERRRRAPGVPLVRRPERILPERRVGVGDHGADHPSGALLVPLPGQRLVPLRPVEHQGSRRSRIAFRSSATIRSIRRSSSSGGSCSAWM